MAPSLLGRPRESCSGYYFAGGGGVFADSVSYLRFLFVSFIVLPRRIEIYISCSRSHSSFRHLKSIDVPFELPVCRLSTIAPNQRYLKITPHDGMLSISRRLPSTHALPYTFSPRLSRRLPPRHSRCRAYRYRPRRLPPRFPRRFSRRLPSVPSVCRSRHLHTARAAFSERLSCRFRDVVPVRPSYRLLIAHAHVYHLRLPHRFVPFYRLALPHHLTPSTSPNGPSRYCGGSTASSHGSARGGKGEHDMPVRSGSARLPMAPDGYARCNT